MAETTNSRLVRLIALGLTLTPALFLAVLIAKYGVDFPQWDEWGYVAFFQKLSLHTLTLGDLFAQVNEYRQFFPNLTFVILGRLTHWDHRYEMWVSFLLACLISFNTYRLARLTIDVGPLRRAFLVFIANLLIFSPAQYPNWFQGQQLVYYVPIACVTTGILVSYSEMAPIARFLICAILATVSTFSSANGVVCWVVLLPVFFVVSHNRIPARGWFLAAWIAGLLSNTALYLHQYRKPWWSPSPLTVLANPLATVLYFLGFLGAPLGLEKGKVAAIAAVLFLLIFAIACALVIRFRRDSKFVKSITPWLMVGAYSILTGVMTTIGRVGLGVGQSMNARYIGYSAYIVVALIFLVPLITKQLASQTSLLGRRRRLAGVTVVCTIVVLLWQPLVFAKGIQKLKEMRLTVLHAKASVLLINQVKDPELVIILYPDLRFLAAQANILDQLGYLRPRLLGNDGFHEFQRDQANTTGFGALDHLERHESIYVVSGTATLPYRGEAADAVVLSYEQPNGESTLFAITHPRTQMTGLRISDSDVGQLQRWELSFSSEQLPSRPAKISAWAFDANDARAYRLDGNFVIP